MSRPPPLWHSEVKALRASGVDPRIIADRFDKSITTVLWVLDEHGERDATRIQVREGRIRARIRARRGTDRPEQRCAEVLRARRITRETIAQACHDFASYKIDRKTLMARITPGGRT